MKSIGCVLFFFFGITNSIKRASKLCRCFFNTERMAQKRLIYHAFEPFPSPPKPRAEGSSPSAPATHFWLRKAISEAFSLLILPKIIPPLCDVQIYGAVESVYRRLLCGLSTVDINSLGGLYAFVSEQNGNILNRYAVVVENTR